MSDYYLKGRNTASSSSLPVKNQKFVLGIDNEFHKPEDVFFVESGSEEMIIPDFLKDFIYSNYVK